MVINYTYTDQGRQMMILDLGAPVSVAGVGCFNILKILSKIFLTSG